MNFVRCFCTTSDGTLQTTFCHIQTRQSSICFFDSKTINQLIGMLFNAIITNRAWLRELWDTIYTIYSLFLPSTLCVCVVFLATNRLKWMILILTFSVFFSLFRSMRVCKLSVCVECEKKIRWDDSKERNKMEKKIRNSICVLQQLSDSFDSRHKNKLIFARRFQVNFALCEHKLNQEKKGEKKAEKGTMRSGKRQLICAASAKCENWRATQYGWKSASEREQNEWKC